MAFMMSKDNFFQSHLLEPFLSIFICWDPTLSFLENFKDSVLAVGNVPSNKTELQVYLIKKLFISIVSDK